MLKIVAAKHSAHLEESPEQIRERLRATLEESGYALTAQRRVIFQELAACRDHPTAEELHGRLREHLPELSLATVYKNLHIFSRLGLARPVATPDGKARFDAGIVRHHHLRCVQCGSIVDLVGPGLDIEVPKQVVEQSGYLLLDAEIQLSGLCPACQKDNGNGGASGRRPGLRRRSGPRSRTS